MKIINGVKEKAIVPVKEFLNGFENIKSIKISCILVTDSKKYGWNQKISLYCDFKPGSDVICVQNVLIADGKLNATKVNIHTENFNKEDCINNIAKLKYIVDIRLVQYRLSCRVVTVDGDASRINLSTFGFGSISNDKDTSEVELPERNGPFPMPKLYQPMGWLTGDVSDIIELLFNEYNSKED